MRPEIPKLGLKDKQDSAQPLMLKGPAASGVFLKIVLQLILVLHIKKLVSHLKKGLALLLWNPQLVLQVVAQKALHMPHAELKRHSGIDDLAGPHQPQISINDKALDGIGDGVPEGLESGNPVLGIFPKMKAGVGNVLSVHIPGQEKSMLYTLHKDTFPIGQKIPSGPLGLKLLSYLLKALAVCSQLLNPSPSCMRVNAQLSAHSPIGSLLRKIQLCRLHLLLQPVLRSVKKCPSTFQALPALEADPIAGPFLNTRSVFSAPERTATGTTFFSSIDSSSLSLSQGGGSTRFHTLPRFALMAHKLVSKLRLVKVYSPNPDHRTSFAAELSRELDLNIEAVHDPREVMRSSDIVLAMTNSVDPVLKADWLEEGMHVTSVKGEVDRETLKRADLIALNSRLRYETRIAGVGQYGSLVLQKNTPHGLPLDREQYPLLEDIIAGKVTGRTSEKQITYFDSGSGLGIQFAATAYVIYRLAREGGLGREIPNEWFTQTLHT